MALIQTGFSRFGSVGRLLIGYSIIICRTFMPLFGSSCALAAGLENPNTLIPNPTSKTATQQRYGGCA